MAGQAVQVVGSAVDPNFTFNAIDGDRRIVSGPWPAGAPIGKMATTYSPQGGLHLSLDVTGLEEVGYYPITVKVSQGNPATATRIVEVRLHAGSDDDDGQSIAVDVNLEIPRGRESASRRFLIPKYQDWHYWGWETSVDGQRDAALSVDKAGWPWQPQIARPIVWILPTASGYAERLKPAVEQIVGGHSIADFKTVAPEELPDDWLEYTAADLVVMLAEDLPKLAAEQPERTKTLLRWIRAGGNLWLMRSGTDWESLPAVDAVLEPTAATVGRAIAPPRSDAAHDGDADPLPGDRWRRPPVGATSVEAVATALLLSDVRVEEVEARPAPKPADPNFVQLGSTFAIPAPGPRDAAGNPLPKEASRWYALRGHGFGLVAAFRTPTGWGRFAGRFPAEALKLTPIAPRLSWIDRFGNHPHDANMQFNNWLIPGVGMAPVVQFQVLLTLFALAVGPLNYWLLARRGKLPMLLATIPVAAVATTVAFFAYGLFADGIGVRLRSRSLSMLDQRTGEAATWSRCSYYAGLAPSGGVDVRPGTAVYPILPAWAVQRRRVSGPMRVMALDDDGLHLSSGWVTSRTPTQYLTTSARQSDQRLDIRPTADGLRVRNRLGVDVRQLLIQVAEGEVYWFENLADDATQIAPRTDMSAIAIKIRREFTAHFPEYPPGGDPSSLGAGSYYTTALSKNLLEANLDALNAPGVESWGDRTYLAVTDGALTADLVAEGAVEEDSFHVIRGEW